MLQELKAACLSRDGMADEEVQHCFQDMNVDHDDKITVDEWETYWASLKMGDVDASYWINEVPLITCLITQATSV